MAREDVVDVMLDECGRPVNPEDAEAVADWYLKQNGVVFGQASSIYTEEQLARLTRRRKEISLDDVYERDVTDVRFRSSQELLDLARDELAAGKVAGISPDQAQILKMILDGFTVREISDDLGYCTSYTHELMQSARSRIKNRGSALWIWLTLADIFHLGVSVVRDELSK